MKMTLTKINNSEWKLSRGHSPFFILKQKNDIYYSSCLNKYEPIKEQIKEWLLEEAIPQFYFRTDMDFEFSIITSITRDMKLKELGI